MGILNFVFNALIGTCVLIYNDDKIFFLTSNFIISNILLTIYFIYFLNLQNNMKKKTTDDKFLHFFLYDYYGIHVVYFLLLIMCFSPISQIKTWLSSFYISR